MRITKIKSDGTKNAPKYLDLGKYNGHVENRPLFITIYKSARFGDDDIVRQNREFVSTTARLERIIARLTARQAVRSGEAESAEASPCSLFYERSDEIFERIRRLADSEQVWRNTGIAREAFAEMAGCNRTYLTEVLKSKKGMGIRNYCCPVKLF